MRLSLIRYAEIYARFLAKEFGKNVEYLSIVEGAEEFLSEQGILEMPEAEELQEFIDYVDYLVGKSEITVTLPKERL